MKDIDKDLPNEENKVSDIQESIDFDKEEAENVTDDKYGEKSEQEDQAQSQSEIKDNVEEEGCAEEQAEALDEESIDAEEKENGDSEKVAAEEELSQQCSSSYAPPYYVPTVVTGANASSDDKKDKRGKHERRGVVLLVTVALLACLGISFVSGALAGMIIPSITDSLGISQSGKDVISVKKNQYTINLSENTDVDYVPQSVAEVVQKIGNSVVEISTSSVQWDSFYGQYVTSGAGSGVILAQNDSYGFLLTNHHVVDGASEVIVRLTNGDEYNALVLDSTKNFDIAVLKIEKKGDEEFTVAPIGSSESLVVGQEVIAIGNPLGQLGGTVTDGIISALDRNIVIDGVSMVLLQHNAAINPGNSGGGLFDMMGNLIGIVNAKSSDTGIEGLGFAIPIDLAYDIFENVMENGYISGIPTLGIEVDYGTPAYLGYTEGLYVIDATNNADFKKLDRIIAINDRTITSAADYYAAIDELEIGDEVTVTVSRSNRKLDIKTTVMERVPE